MRKNFVSYGDSEVILSEIKAKYLSKSEVPYTASKVETGYIEDNFSANGSGSANIIFSSPMPDTDYLVVTDCDRVGVEIGIINKTVNGFTLVVANNNVSELLIRVDYTAFELFELTTIAEIESDISTRLKIVFDMSDIESPAENQTVLYMGETTTAEPIYKQGGIYEYDGTVWQLKSADNITLDNALDTTSNNAVKNSVIATEVNKRLTVTDTMPTASADLLGQTRLYIGSTTTNYQEGGIYKCESDGQTPPTYSWNIKNKADIDLSLYKKIFTGTQSTWNTLTDAQKKEYDIANITDDTEDSVVDEVTDGDMRAVTSNAVYGATKTTRTNLIPLVTLGESVKQQGALFAYKTGRLCNIIINLLIATADIRSGEVLLTLPVGFRQGSGGSSFGILRNPDVASGENRDLHVSINPQGTITTIYDIPSGNRMQGSLIFFTD